MRIISLVPSITELLFDLGLKDQLIGRTKFCIHPMPHVKQIQQFGGTKNVHVDKVLQARPDLIIANKEENLQAEIEFLQANAHVLVTDVSTLEENNAMIREIGELTNTANKANELIEKINTAFNTLKHIEKKPSALYLIWKDPMMSIGRDTFVNEMIYYAGFENILKDKTRYPEVAIDDNIQPEYILLSSEPFPFKEKHVPEIQAKFPNAKILLVDGEMFSWYGSRMCYAPSYFKQLRTKINL